jgi:hypothetical protein
MYSKMLNTKNKWKRVQWSTLQCKWTVESGDQQSIACDVRYSAVIYTTLQENDTVLWSIHQCLWRRNQCGDHHYSAVWWSTLHCKRKIHCGVQQYSESERCSFEINNTVQEKCTLRRLTPQYDCTLPYRGQQYGASENTVPWSSL